MIVRELPVVVLEAVQRGSADGLTAPEILAALPGLSHPVSLDHVQDVLVGLIADGEVREVAREGRVRFFAVAPAPAPMTAEEIIRAVVDICDEGDNLGDNLLILLGQAGDDKAFRTLWTSDVVTIGTKLGRVPEIAGAVLYYDKTVERLTVGWSDAACGIAARRAVEICEATMAAQPEVAP